MNIVKSLMLQLQEDPSWEKMSAADRRVCQALVLAIHSVQRPDFFGRLPKTISEPLLDWQRGKTRKWNASPESVRTQVAIGEALGLKRTRGNRSSQPSAFQFAARRLGISENTVANKAGRRQLPRTHPTK